MDVRYTEQHVQKPFNEGGFQVALGVLDRRWFACITMCVVAVLATVMVLVGPASALAKSPAESRCEEAQKENGNPTGFESERVRIRTRAHQGGEAYPDVGHPWRQDSQFGL